MHYLSKAYNAILNFIAPPFCLFCKDFLSQDVVFCETCRSHIAPVVSAILHVTKKHSVKVFAISAYTDPVRALILAKGNGDIVASRRLGDLMWDLTYVKSADFDYIIPVPLL